MTEIRVPTPYGFTLFCDDIRNEMDGKVTLVGIYTAEMIFNVPFPVIIPKLGFVVKYFERRDESSEPLNLQIYFPGDPDDTPSVVSQIPHEQFRITPAQSDNENNDPLLFCIMNMVISPVNILKEGRIKVRMIRGQDTIKIGSLKIKTTAVNFETDRSTAA